MMKKRLFALLLAALMLMPLCVPAFADEVPAEPKLTVSEVYYIYYQKTAPNPAQTELSGVASSDENDGKSINSAKATYGALDGKGVMGLLAGSCGGTIVIPGKGYIGTDNYEFPDVGGVVKVTALDPADGTQYEGTVDNEDQSGNGTQYGMFMTKDGVTFLIGGQYIFDHITILSRDTMNPWIMSVRNGGALVLTDSVKVAKMANSPACPILNVEEGGICYLHTSGFSGYMGSGTIVADKALFDEGKLTAADFEFFSGKVVDATGASLVEAGAGSDTEKATEQVTEKTTEKATEKVTEKTTEKATEKATGKTTEKATEKTTEKASTSDESSVSVPLIIGIAAAVVVAAAVVIVIVVSKKKKKA